MLDTTTPATSADRYARWAGLVAGAGAATYVAGTDSLGIGLLFALPAFGLCAVAGVLLGDALTPRPTGTVRAAGLTPRRMRDLAPRRLTALLLAQGGFLAVLLAVAAALASPDDMGRAGRSLVASCHGMTEAAGPWPGLFYGLPAAVAVTVATVVCAGSLRRVTHRPGDPERRLERASAIVAAWGILVAGTLAGTAVRAGATLRGLSCDGAIGTAAVWVLLPVALLALCTTLWCLYTVLSPRADRR
ncbi:hypothetical protein [Streptomyces vilmorinianum]|uniref:hypothetical protein n=1 Tax=Streptomyces vilmorinianum TaxID=3051092 RepID=UPI0020C8219F|nr:hypothetical protein [Streptomyces vilmorinianum]